MQSTLLQGQLMNNKPALITVDAGILWNDPGAAGGLHTIVVTGYQTTPSGQVTGYYVNDSGVGKAYYVPKTQFEKAWRGDSTQLTIPTRVYESPKKP